MKSKKIIAIAMGITAMSFFAACSNPNDAGNSNTGTEDQMEQDQSLPANNGSDTFNAPVDTSSDTGGMY